MQMRLCRKFRVGLSSGLSGEGLQAEPAEQRVLGLSPRTRKYVAERRQVSLRYQTLREFNRSIQISCIGMFPIDASH
jgi:hypothetical protein